tara:strand:+ start:44 stop:916 length:873 start_codon:yes stop_codon:yes gene_type:complete
MDTYYTEYNNNNTNNQNNFHYLKLVTIVLFVIFCYCLFNKYAMGDNIAWIIIPGILLLLSIMFNFHKSKDIVNVVSSITFIIISISLILTAIKIRKKVSEEKDESIIYKLQNKYLITLLLFLGLSGITMSPIADWIAGNNENAMYSKKFIFLYTVICYSIFIFIDTIRNYNLFDLKKVLFDGDDTDPTNTKFGIIITVSLWMLYSLLVFDGIRFIGDSTNGDNRHYISIALFTLFWVIGAFIYFQFVKKDCSKLGPHENKSNYQEIILNIVSYTFILLVLTFVDNKFIRI